MKRTYHPVSLYDLETMAKQHLSYDYWDVVAGGSGDEITIQWNREAFDAISMRPRFLVDVSNRDLSTTVLGQRISFPVMVAPAGTATLAHSEGDVATARACDEVGTLMSVTAKSGKPIKEIVKATSSPVWYSVKHYPDDITEYLVKKAKAAGCTAICITVVGENMKGTTPGITGWSPSYTRAFREEYPGIWMHLRDEPRLWQKVKDSDMNVDAPLTGKRLEWLKGLTDLPLVVKEIMTAEDARRSVDHGADAIIVSNHGGRSFDTMQSSIEVVQEIAEAVGDKAEIYLDSGVRRGTDVLKAIALGARAVMLGRPVFWGLAVGGEAGVRKMFEILRTEFDSAMAYCGCKSVADIDSTLVATPWQK